MGNHGILGMRLKEPSSSLILNSIMFILGGKKEVMFVSWVTIVVDRMR